jgi:hypothetical protein
LSPHKENTLKPGEKRLQEALQRRRERVSARRECPVPYDDDWGWWVEQRLARLEKGQAWLIRIALGALAAEALRILLDVLS